MAHYKKEKKKKSALQAKNMWCGVCMRVCTFYDNPGGKPADLEVYMQFNLSWKCQKKRKKVKAWL